MMSQNSEIIDFPNIPKNEKKQKWFLLLEPLVAARKLRTEWKKAPLIQVLNQRKGIRTWKSIKAFIDYVLKNVDDAESMFSRASQIKTDPDPDSVIKDMIGELRAVLYLLHKGFKNIRYFRRENIDFTVEFDNNIYYIEVAYIRGPIFKTQRIAFIPEVTQQPVYFLDSKKLVSRLKSLYAEKRNQIIKHGYNESNSIILFISDLEELYEPYLEWDKVQEEHPILHFIKTRKIPTIIFSPATVYEPEPASLNGVFGKLNKFEWDLFNRQI